eukprot:28224-Chlamydomonas_euryale.AAC.4
MPCASHAMPCHALHMPCHAFHTPCNALHTLCHILHMPRLNVQTLCPSLPRPAMLRHDMSHVVFMSAGFANPALPWRLHLTA